MHIGASSLPPDGLDEGPAIEQAGEGVGRRETACILVEGRHLERATEFALDEGHHTAVVPR